MFMRKLLIFAAVLVLGWSIAFAQAPNLGKPIELGEITVWDISILPDGTGLPPGGGTPEQGAPIYVQKCFMCHGENGKGGGNAALVGGDPLTGMESPKTIAHVLPYAPTPFHYVRRAQTGPRPG